MKAYCLHSQVLANILTMLSRDKVDVNAFPTEHQFKDETLWRFEFKRIAIYAPESIYKKALAILLDRDGVNYRVRGTLALADTATQKA